NPLVGKNDDGSPECSIQARIEERVVITDPQPGWIVSKLEVRGIAPSDSKSVSAVAFSADYRNLSPVITTLETLVANQDTNLVETLESQITPLESFLYTYSLYEYDDLSAVVASLNAELVVLMESENQEVTEGEEPTTYDYSNLSSILENLKGMLQEPISVGSTSDLGESSTGAQSFYLDSDAELVDNKLYDLVAIAVVGGGNTKSSAPVRFSVDSSLNVGKPIPRSIGGEVIAGALALDNLFINGVLAEDGVIEITDDRPTVSGDSEYGAQVFAVWESVVLASSVISDSEEGAFDIQAPKNLGIDESHKVTLYAVKADGDDKLRSESIDVHFRIKGEAFPWTIVYWVIGILLVLAILVYALRKRLKKRGEMPTEETAEEEIAEIEKAYEAMEETTPEAPVAEPMVEPTPEVQPEAPAPVEPVAEPQPEAPVAEPTPELTPEPAAEMPAATEVAHEEAVAMEEEVKVEEPVVETTPEAPVVEPMVEPQPEVAPENPVEPEGPASEEHQSMENELNEAFGSEENKEM
ncbi:hypothetical protein KKA95_00920, partial [Patescibacteria group bacterium]|nr:hypothetical protein [Patescibacteria group bacterium]